MNIEKIGSIEAIALIVAVMINHIFLNLPKAILSSTGSASIINVIYISIIAIILTYLVYKLFKPFPNSDIIDISKFLSGKWLSIIIGILFILYLISTTSTLIRDFSESLKLIYFPNIPIFVIVLVFIITSVIANKFSSKAVITCNLIIVPIALISIFFAFFSTMDKFIPQRALPILGNGINATFFSGLSNIFSFSGLIYIYLLKPMLKQKKDFKKISVIAIIISSIYLLLSIVSLLFMFPFIISSEEVLSAYLSSRAIQLGRFFQRTDALFILIWILSLLSYLSIAIMFITNIFQKISKTKHASPMIYCFSSLIFAACLIPKDIIQIRFAENVVYKYFSLILIFGISLTILILANIKYRRKYKLKEGDIQIE